MKIFLKVVLTMLPVLLLLFLITAPLINFFSAYGLEKSLRTMDLPEDTRFVESLSATGRFYGNGNGAQRIAAMLIESGLPEAELQEYYVEQGFLIEAQEGREITVVDHGSLSFESELDPEKAYYIVYRISSGVEPDLRGH